MAYSKMIPKLIISFALCLLLASPDKSAYVVIEQSTPGVIGSILGGITAGISVIFGILITIRGGQNSINFSGYLSSLKLDLVILVGCLAASILLPYVRITGLPLLSYPTHDLIPSKDRTITALELWVILLSLNLIVEVISCLILVLKVSLSAKQDEKTD